MTAALHILSRRELLDFVAARRALFDAASVRNPFACAAWVETFLQRVAKDTWEFVVPVHGDGADESSMLLYRRNAQDRNLKPLTNYYASLYSPIVSAAVPTRTSASALVAQVETLAPGTLKLAPVDEGVADLLQKSGTFGVSRWHVKRYFCFGNWTLPSTGMSFADYLGARDSRLRNTLTRKSKKFAAAGGRLEVITGPADVERGLAAYWAIYAKSWKKPEPYPDFISDWARACAQHGWLRLGVAWLRDDPVAVQFWFTMHGRTSIFKLAYDEAFAQLSAGTILTAHLLADSLDREHVDEVDYLTGDDDYKASWMSARRVRVGLLACNLRTLPGLVAAAREVAADVQQRLRREDPTRPRSAADPAPSEAG